MNRKTSIAVMSALAQPTRLATFEALVRVGDRGMSSGELAGHVGTSTASMSAHLAILARAELIEQEKVGRSVVCRAAPAQVQALVSFLNGLA